MSAISSRRFLIVALLLVTAVAGALLRSFSAPQSTPYYVGTLLMVMWVPVVGNIISFLVRKLAPRTSAPTSFNSSMPFVPQLLVELQLNSEQGLPSKEHEGRIHCLFIMGTEGFSALVSLLESPMDGAPLNGQVQFLFPAAALAKFPIGSTFHLMQGRSGIGTGRVLSLSPHT